MLRLIRITFAFSVLGVVSCTPLSSDPEPGPDKQAVGTWYGAAMGATSGAVTGAQLSAGTGPGAVVGAGIGAVFGMMSGLGVDLLEEDQLNRMAEADHARAVSWAQHVLAGHYMRRLELHPSRDIYPADLFFDADEVKLRHDSQILVNELAKLTKRRMPWSRIVVASYVTSRNPDSEYAAYLTKRRAEEIAVQFVRAGIEARRVTTQGITMPDPIVIDPHDVPGRYRQAIEIIPTDY